MNHRAMTHKEQLFRSASKWGAGALAALIVSNASPQPIAAMAFGGFIALAPFALVQLVRALWAAVSASPDELRALTATATLPYRHFYGGSGVALDPQKHELHLYAKPHYRVYPYAHVRGWERNLVEPGAVVSGGMQGAALNVQQGLQARAASGLFVTVKDVEHPRWRIRFAKPQLKRELPRWMEILEQQINES